LGAIGFSSTGENSEGGWQSSLSAERFEIILSMNHPAKAFSAMLGDLGAFRRKSSIADNHRRHRPSFVKQLFAASQKL